MPLQEDKEERSNILQQSAILVRHHFLTVICSMFDNLSENMYNGSNIAPMVLSSKMIAYTGI